MKFLLLWKFNQTSVLWLARQLQGISKPDCFLWILAQTSSGSHCKMSFQLQTISYSLEFAHRQHFNNINMYFISKKYNVFQFPINSKCSVFVFSLTLREPWSVAAPQFPNSERVSLNPRMIFRVGQLPGLGLVMAFVNWGAASSWERPALSSKTGPKPPLGTEVPPPGTDDHCLNGQQWLQKEMIFGAFFFRNHGRIFIPFHMCFPPGFTCTLARRATQQKR